MKKSVFIAVVPPPLTGMTNVSQTIFSILSGQVDRMISVRISRPRWMRGRLGWKIYKHVLFVFVAILYLPLIRVAGYKNLYLVSDANRGLGTTWLMVKISALLGFNTSLHHHVSRYIRSYVHLMKSIANTGVRHLFLDEEMANDFCRLYSMPANYARVLPNEFMVIDQVCAPTSSAASYTPHEDTGLVMGYISNITLDKGFDLIVELFLSLPESVRLHIAGPFADAASLSLFKANLEGNSRVKYFGPIYGGDKKSFLSSIDVLVFPTKYENEAQPLVVYESLAAGKPVVAFDRGSISRQIGDAGFVSRDLNHMKLIIERLLFDGEELADLARAAAQRGTEIVENGRITKASLTKIIWE